MLGSPLINELFKAVQENALPAIWSQGVTLTRGASTFVASSQGAEECIIHVRTPGHPVSPKVTLWPKDLDWDCDCGHPESPCPHVAASVIVMKKGELKTAAALASTEPTTGASEALAQVHYIFRRGPEGLLLERKIIGPGLSKNLDIPLLSYKSGIDSKRLQGPDVMASKTDYAIDQVLGNYRGAALERLRLEALFKNFDADQNIFLEETPIQVSSSRLLAQYECVDEADGYRLRRIKNPLITETFRHGVALCTDTLRLMNSTQLLPDEQRLVENEGSFWGGDREKALFSDVIPRLQKKISITVSSLKRPQTIEVPPRIELRLEKEKNPSGEICLSVLANIVYGDPAIAQLNYTTLELSPVQDFRSQRVAQVIRRNQDEERLLMQKLSRELDLQPGRRILLRGPEAIEFVRKSKTWNPLGDGASLFYADSRTLEPRVAVNDDARYGVNISFVSSESGQESEASFEAVFKAWQQGGEHVPLLDGSWAKVPKD